MGKESSASSEQSKDAADKSGPVASAAAPVATAAAASETDSTGAGSGELLKRIRLWQQFIQCVRLRVP